jgi:alpha-L-fucosidase
MEVVIDLGATVKLGAFSDQSPTDGGTGGGVDRDEFATRADGQAWVLAAEGEFANIRANPREQTLAPTAPGAGRFIRFVVVHAHADAPPAVAELSVTAR